MKSSKFYPVILQKLILLPIKMVMNKPNNLLADLRYLFK